jgi:hypothetical protein
MNFDIVNELVKIVESYYVLQVFTSLYRQEFERRWRSVNTLRVFEKLSNQDVGMFPDMNNVI